MSNASDRAWNSPGLVYLNTRRPLYADTETNVSDDPAVKRVLCVQGSRRVEHKIYHYKTSISLMFMLTTLLGLTLKCSWCFTFKIGHELCSCTDLVRNMALKQHDRVMLQKAEDFLKVRASEWPAVVTGPALATLSRRKQNRPDI